MSHPDPQSEYGENEVAPSKYGYGPADIHPSKRPHSNPENVRDNDDEKCFACGCPSDNQPCTCGQECVEHGKKD